MQPNLTFRRNMLPWLVARCWWSAKEVTLPPPPPLRTGHESFPSSGSSRCKAPPSRSPFTQRFQSEKVSKRCQSRPLLLFIGSVTRGLEYDDENCSGRAGPPLSGREQVDGHFSPRHRQAGKFDTKP